MTRIQHLPDSGDTRHEVCGRAIIPVRRPDIWWRSINEESFTFMQQRTVVRNGMQGWMKRRESAIYDNWHPRDVLHVQYEFIVASPVEAGRLICHHAGVQFVEWPEPIVNGNAKYEREAVVT